MSPELPPQTAAGILSPAAPFWGSRFGVLIDARSRVTTPSPVKSCRRIRNRRFAGRNLGAIMRALKRQKGIAFDVADLLGAQTWAASCNWQFKIWLDHGTEDEEYDEVIAFSAGMNPQARSIMWRTAKAVFVQPLLGRRRRYSSVAEALTSLLPKQPVDAAVSKAALKPRGRPSQPGHRTVPANTR
jgi:hypothetical protein